MQKQPWRHYDGSSVFNATRALLGLTLVTLTLSAPGAGKVQAYQSSTGPYTVVSADNSRKSLNVRQVGGTDMIALDQVAQVFGLALREDTLAGGMTVTGSRQTAVLTLGQAGVSIGGRVLTLSAPIVRDGRSWVAPLDVLSRVISPAIGQRIDVRPGSRTILVGDIRWPQVAVRLERQGTGVRVAADVQPATPFRLQRDGNVITVRFEASAVDLSLSGAAVPDLIGSVRAEGASVIVTLGAAASLVRPAEDAAGGHFTVDVSPAPRPGQDPPSLTSRTGLKIVAIDAGHGGDDAGARSTGGVLEKDVALALARKLRSAIEARLGARVVMTREGDDLLPLDRRTSIVNNSQADVLISIHADAAFRPALSGARVLTLEPGDYQRRLPASTSPAVTVPIAGGDTRTIDVVPWDMAQLSQIEASVAFATSLEQHLREHQVPLFSKSLDTLPLRLLAATNTRAVMIQAGFLSNDDEATAIAGDERQSAIVEALIAALTDLRAMLTRGGGL